MNDFTYRQAIEQSDAIKKLGIKSIYLNRDDEKPWQHVTDCREGGTHRLDISTDVRFSARDPDTGITFDWTFDLEPYSANGTGHYQIDAEGCLSVLHKLPETARRKFADLLANNAEKIRSSGREYLKLAQRQFGDAEVFSNLSLNP